ncbi:MAG: MoxR family ATPase [Gammaproteobacteria bacterium]|nr:MoxR family ATPase [Gammaproteobacteria bacterium]
MSNTPENWWIFRGDGLDRPENAPPHERMEELPPPPRWRDFAGSIDQVRGECFQPEPSEIEKVNAALYLRRPLLITGKPGTGKTTLTYAVAKELGLGKVLRWSITSRTVLSDGLYRYDAIARLQDVQKGGRPPIEEYLTLGPLGSAFFARKHKDKNYPRVLLIDEIDKSDIDLPNDLLHIFEEGLFEIPELKRLKKQQNAKIRLYGSDEEVDIIKGQVKCETFPLIVMTSNGEREFPPAFLRRCLHLKMEPPENTDENPKLTNIVKAHLQIDERRQEWKRIEKLIEAFLKKRDGSLEQKDADSGKDLATDQLLNAIYLTLNGIENLQSKEALLNSLWQSLSEE